MEAIPFWKGKVEGTQTKIEIGKRTRPEEEMKVKKIW